MAKNEGLIQAAASSQIKAKNKTTPATIQGWIERYQSEIKKALPDVMTPERFTRIALSAVSANPKLAQTTPMSFLAAMMQAAQLGLEPNTPLGQAYLIPYGNQCQFQIGYKGLRDLAYRSGEIKSIQAQTVYENDTFEFEYGLESDKMRHVPALENRGNPRLYWAKVSLKNGGYIFEVMSREDVERHRDRYSKTRRLDSPWNSAFDEMAKKTVLKRVLKYAPLSSEVAARINSDETVKEELSDDMFSVPPEDVFVSDALVLDAQTEEAPH